MAQTTAPREQSALELLSQHVVMIQKVRYRLENVLSNIRGARPADVTGAPDSGRPTLMDMLYSAGRCEQEIMAAVDELEQRFDNPDIARNTPAREASYHDRARLMGGQLGGLMQGMTAG